MGPRGSSRAVSQRDVARRAGVSVSAVSMALAGHPRIGAETRRQIEEAAEELGYVVNSAAKALRGQRSGSIALIIPNTGQHVFGHSYFSRLMVGVSNVANEHDSTLILSTNPDERHGVAAYERILRSRAADGAIVASAAAEDPQVLRLVDSGLPVVLVGRFPRIPDALTVGIEDYEGSRLATRHLLKEHGLRRVAHIAGPLEHQTALDRLAGYRRAFTDMRRKPPSLVVTGDFDEDSGRAAMKALLASGRPEGIVAANDEMAYGALLELRAQGIRVPEDIALIGFDDFGLARLPTPALSTVTVPAVDLGRIAAQRLFEIIDESPPDRRHQSLPVALTIRQSCGCPHP